MSSPSNPLSEVNEADLVRRAQERDDAAFQELMRRTRSSSLRLALSIVKNREDAEDQVQASFFNAWRRLGSFQFEAKFSTWFRTIVVNQSLMHLRSRRRTPVQPLDSGREDVLPADPADTTPDHEVLLSRSQTSDVVRREIRRLPPLFREIIELRDIQELPAEEVASRLGITEAAVKSRLFRARQLLRRRLQPDAQKSDSSRSSLVLV